MDFILQLLEMYLPLKRQPVMPSALNAWLSKGYPKISLDAAGLVALADLSTVARRTARTGNSCLLDALIVCPGLHKQQDAPELNGGEYPACAAMTTGYVFRVENPATVLYLQKVGETGHLTTLAIKGLNRDHRPWRRTMNAVFDVECATLVPTVSYLAAVALALVVVLLLILLRDWWALIVVLVLILARLINVVVIRRRATIGWKGASEPGVNGDLLILLSQDRWIRLRGAVDDLKVKKSAEDTATIIRKLIDATKAVTSGQWLREPTFLESSLVAFSTLLVYLDAALAGNAHQEGKILLLVLLFCSVGLLGVANEYTEVLQMHGRVLKVEGRPKEYARRLELAEQLIKETGRDDWAVRMGMTVPKRSDNDEREKSAGPVTM